MNGMTLRSKWVTTAALAAGLVTAGACNVREELLSPQQPGTILPGDIAGAGAAGAEALRVGALGRFQQLTPGGGNGNQTEATLLGDLLADVWKSGDTFTQHNETDQRAVSTNNSVLSTAYSDLTRSRGFYRDAIRALLEASPERKGAVAEQWFVMGYSEMLLAELFCNGAPLGETVNGQFTLGTPKTNAEVYAIALTHLDSDLDALTAAGTSGADAIRPLPRHPFVVRDLSIVVADTLPAAIIRGTIQAASRSLPAPLVDPGGVVFFDRYQGKGVPDGSVSLSLRLTFQAADRTLTDAEVQASFDAILTALVREHGAIQR